MITNEQNKLSFEIIELLENQTQKWLSKKEIKQRLQPQSLDDFEFVLRDLEHFRIIEFIRNGLNVRLTENARDFKGLKKEYHKKERTETFRFWITTTIAIISLIVSIWLYFENDELKLNSNRQETEIKLLNDRIIELHNEIILKNNKSRATDSTLIQSKK